MKVAFASESLLDDAALRILVNAVLGAPTQEPSGRAAGSLRLRSWPQPRDRIPTIYRSLYYGSDADALVVVVDSDRSPPHVPEHDSLPDGTHPDCRLCVLRQGLNETYHGIRPVAGRVLRFAVGLAVPEIHAWYRCGRDPNVNERVWIAGLRTGNPPYTIPNLKRAVHGTDRVPLDTGLSRVREEAQRLARDISRLEDDFPGGFATLAAVVRAW